MAATGAGVGALVPEQGDEELTAKTIVFCADGTWNGPNDDDNHDGVPDHTNVLKFFLGLAGSETAADWRLMDEQEKELRNDQNELLQIAKYLHGVGDSKNPLVRMLGGVLGKGLIPRIVRGYTFLSRNYQPGDRIVLVGFSRGAYTVRALSGLVANLGLLRNENNILADKEQAYRLGLAAWVQHRTQAQHGHDASLLQRLVDIADDLPAFASRPLDPSQYTPADIEAIGVWDTVGSYGIPEYHGDARLDTFKFTDCKLCRNVKSGFHAVSIDERRADFTPTLWDDDERVTQVLFAGAHSDVGGGYPAAEGGLSDCALTWMMQALSDSKVQFTRPLPFALSPEPGAGSHQPWAQPAFAMLPQGPRTFPPGLRVHTSVIERLARTAVTQYGVDAPGPYRPDNLAGYLDGAWRLKQGMKTA